MQKDLDAIRQVFKDIDKEGVLLHYYPVEPPEIQNDEKEQADEQEQNGKNPRSKKRSGLVETLLRCWNQYKKEVQPRKFGGLAHTVAAINAVIVGAMIAVAINPPTIFDVPPPFWTADGLKKACGYGLAGAAIAFMAQLAYVAFREAKVKAKLRQRYPTHAGGVVFRKKEDGIEYLLVSAKNDPREFVLPKGHIEKGEGHGEAALREVREEAGVVARLIGLVASNLEFKAGDKRVNAKFYLMEWLFDVEPKEKRQIKWLSFDEALGSLEFPEGTYALKQAEAQRSARHRQERSKTLQMKRLPTAMDDRAPDGSEIRLLSALSSGGVCHCTLPVGGVSRAVSHLTVEEIWYFLSGKGEVWRKLGGQEEIVDAYPGVSLTIPLGARFQFRNTGAEPLSFIVTTMPPWPGPDEAVPAPGHW